MVIRSEIGAAPAIARALDRVEHPLIVGTIAGDDTCLVIARTAAGARTLRLSWPSRSHLALVDSGDALGRTSSPSTSEPVEDVDLLVAEHLVDLADLLAVRVDDRPAGLDHQPGDRIPVMSATYPRSASDGLASTYQTGPCVATGCVSESTRRTVSRPVMPSASRRSRQRRGHLRRGAVAERAARRGSGRRCGPARGRVERRQQQRGPRRGSRSSRARARSTGRSSRRAAPRPPRPTAAASSTSAPPRRLSARPPRPASACRGSARRRACRAASCTVGADAAARPADRELERLAARPGRAGPSSAAARSRCSGCRSVRAGGPPTSPRAVRIRGDATAPPAACGVSIMKPAMAKVEKKPTRESERALGRAAARALPRDAADPPLRGEGRGAVPRGRAARLPARRDRPGGRRRRCLRGARAGRRDRVHPPRARAHDRARARRRTR